MRHIHESTCALSPPAFARPFRIFGSLLLVGAYTIGCDGDSVAGTTQEEPEVVDSDQGGGDDAGDAPTDEAGEDGASQDGPHSGDAPNAVWNPVSCQVDDDGSSRESGGLEVRSLVLVPDSSTDANDGTTVYYPALLETDSSCTFSVIGWGNGTTGFGGADYPAYFNHLASYGFVVAVAHTNLTMADSQPILASIELVMAAAEDPESTFFEKLDTAFGLMGKSQGAIAAGRELAELDAVAGVLIASGSPRSSPLTKPGLFITGDSDFAQPFVVSSYNAATGPAVLAQAAQEDNPGDDPSAGHQELNEREGAVELSTSFMRCHLQSNDNACDYVNCAQCQVEPWSLFETNGL